MRPARPEIKRLRWPAASERPVCVLTTGDPSAIFSGMAVTKLDLTGLKCPLPALKTRKALTKLNPGDRLEVHCTDPLAIIDIPNLINQTGDRVEVTQHAERRIVFMIEKVSGAVA